MKAGRIAGAALVVLCGCREALAEPYAIINRQVYNLVADTVNWSMKVGSGQNCLLGVRYGKVQLEKMTLVSPPRSGLVVVQGSAFTYVPKKGFQGDDSFDLKVAGQIQKVPGASTIHVVVSVGSATKMSAPVQPAAPAPTATADTAGRTVPVPRSGGLASVPMPPAPSAASGPVPQLVPSSGGPTPPIKIGQGPAPVLMPPAPGAASGPVPQLRSGPVPMPMTPQPGAASTPMPPVPTASSAAPSSFSISPARSP
jgi:hypothetical protein